MRLSEYRFADYRLAAYVVIGAVIAGGIALALDQAFAPTEKIQANGAPAAAAAAASGANVRQIPLARTNPADLGDPQGKLTPVYPAAPGKDMPIKDTPVIQAAKPAAAAATTGSANPAAPVAAPAQNACNVEACASAYRSFRESDCSYQPMSGPRRYCEGAPINGQTASQPRRYDDSLRDAERAVRRLPPPGQFDNDNDDDSRVVMEAPAQRYDLRRNWVIEPQE